ncbi:MAG: hypothetical protein K2W33_02045 [Burkholderiales bacterium]|nr:hypothetical protein [Burkholderiales bacterium]
MLTTQIFRPTMNSGKVYARLRGSAAPMQEIGGIEQLELAIKETTKKQTDFNRAGGGTRAQVKRVDEVTMKATLQDINPVNLARAVFGSTSPVDVGTITDEAHVAYKGGLIPLAHLNPTAVTLTTAGGSPTTIAAAGNYEVRPEGIFVFDTAVAITDGLAVLVDYTHGAYDLVQAMTDAAPILEMRYAGVNEAMSGDNSVVDLFRVQMGATKKVGLIDSKDFATLDIEGEVMKDPTKTGAGVSAFFKVQVLTPA